jgi:hypothetical protein
MTAFLAVIPRRWLVLWRTPSKSKAANVLNNAFAGGPTYGDGVVLCSTSHPLRFLAARTAIPSGTMADLNETSLEAAVIQIAGVDG